MPSILLVGEVLGPVFMNNIPVCRISKHRVLNYSPVSLHKLHLWCLVCVMMYKRLCFVCVLNAVFPAGTSVEEFLEFTCVFVTRSIR